MSEGPKWDVSFTIHAALKWLPGFVYDTESNFIFVKAEWLCFGLSGSWRK
jgi:hypothetical protein